jgi:hypothetical protein
VTTSVTPLWYNSYNRVQGFQDSRDQGFERRGESMSLFALLRSSIFSAAGIPRTSIWSLLGIPKLNIHSLLKVPRPRIPRPPKKAGLNKILKELSR